MTKLTTLLISTSFLHFTVFSQIEITEITPNFGDQLSYGETTVVFFDPGPSGADVIWDFYSFTGSSEMTITGTPLLSYNGLLGMDNPVQAGIYIAQLLVDGSVFSTARSIITI